MTSIQNKNTLQKGWKWVKLGDMLKVSSGKGLKVNHLQGGEYPVYGGNGITGYHSEYLVESPKLIIGRVGVKCGVTYITKPKSWVTDNALIVEPINQDFDLKFFQLKLGYENLNKLSVSTAQPVISGSKIYAYEILLPPLEQQHTIVSKIEELLSELDKGKQQLETAQQQLKIYRQSVLKWAFEGRLTNKDVKEGELPVGWRLVKLEKIATKITDGEHITPRRTSHGVLLLSARNIQNGYLELKNVDYIPQDEYQRIIKRCNPEHGDILISCSGSVGRVSKVPKDLKFTMVRSVALVKLNSQTHSAKYFEYLFQSPLLQKQIEKGKKATAQANLFLGPIKNLDVLQCSIEEQNLIVQQIESRLSVCDKVEETITSSLAQAETLRQSILKKAFEGKLI